LKILKLILKNFQGIKDKEFDFDGKSASIYGDNGKGKTTVFNAITWVLFDKASTGAKNFTPKTRIGDQDVHFLDHSVEARIQKEDGQIVTLKKVFHEKWTKKRGSTEEEFSGHENVYFIDGVPASEREFSTFVTFLSGNDPEKMKILTMPNYFPEVMSWELRRKILVGIFGDVTDSDILSQNQELQGLQHLLLKPGTSDKFYSVEEFRKIATVQKTELNKQIQEIPGRIDEAQKAIPDLGGGFNLEQMKINHLALEKAKDEAFEEKLQAKSSDISLAVRGMIAEIRTQITENRVAHEAAEIEKNKDIQAEIQRLQSELLAKHSLLDTEKYNLQKLEKELAEKTKLRADLISEYTVISEQKWDESKETCPTCKQTFPSSDIQKIKEEFNLNKSQQLEAINMRGQKEASKEIIAKLEEDIEGKRHTIDSIGAEIINIRENIARNNLEIKPAVEYHTTQEYQELQSKINEYQNEEETCNSAVSETMGKYDKKISEISEKIEACKADIAKFATAETQQKRIDELTKQEKDLSAQYETVQQGLYFCEQFTAAKMKTLSTKINTLFSNVQFRLFQTQINGGTTECCDVMVPSDNGDLIPYQFANNGARINAGIEIIDTFSKKWGVSLPVIVDNAESVTKLLAIDSQCIRLVVSAADQTLRIERE
jgi:DNA repair exonuclease SbcCD ATPase subunit